MMKSRSLFFLLIFLSFSAFSQIEKHAQWKFTISNSAPKIGEVVEITIEADIDEGWYLYSSDHDPKLDAPFAVITFEGPDFKQSGKLKAIGAKEKYDEIWQGNIKTFTIKAKFTQKLTITGPSPVITVKVEGQVCSHVNGLCVQVKEKYIFDTIKVTGSLIVKPDSGSTAKNPDTKTNTPTVTNPSQRLKELEKSKQALIKKDEKGKDPTREYLRDYIKKNGGTQ
ncbi:MAG: protein-disulfide reductase DsbD domain-containing protein [Cytophagaceae bacterium]